MRLKMNQTKLSWICLGTYTTHSQHNVSVHPDCILFHVAGVVVLLMFSLFMSTLH